VFEPSSRYASIDDAIFENKSGEKVAYKRRRFLPNADDMIFLQEITITGGDRLDRIAARVAGDPEQYWRICDANVCMHPLEVTNEPGRVIRIARPWR
jgi:hypothetical protein